MNKKLPKGARVFTVNMIKEMPSEPIRYDLTELLEKWENEILRKCGMTVEQAQLTNERVIEKTWEKK